MNTTALTIDTIRNLMDKSYTLVHISRHDNLNKSLDTLAECIKEKSEDYLYDLMEEWYNDTEQNAMKDAIKELKRRCREQGYINIDAIFEKYMDEIRWEIYSRDDSDTLMQLLANTSDINIRVDMHSNYDCINSHYFEGTYYYEQSYFGAMVDALNLNPREVKRCFDKHGIKTEGYFPNITARNGNELVDYLQFATEISNSVSPANLLTFIATVKVTDLYDAGFNITEITLPKGNSCGIFSHVHGGGSIMEMELRQDITLQLNAKQYDYFSLEIDHEDNRGYALKDTYGVVDSFFGKPITIIKQVA